MISRIWHGWTTKANAGAYENLLRQEILPGIHRVAARARKLLAHFDARSVHYESVFHSD